MEEIFDILSLKLVNKGLIPVEITRLIKDVANILGDEDYFTVATVNQRLAFLGWSEQIIDEPTLDLIIFLFENRDDVEISRHTLH